MQIEKICIRYRCTAARQLKNMIFTVE